MSTFEHFGDMVVGYIRVSTKDKEQNPDLQLKEIKNWCLKEKAEYTIHFQDEGISGEIADRPGLWALYGYLSDHPRCIVLCRDPTRLSRDTSVMQRVLDKIHGYKCKVRYTSSDIKPEQDGHDLINYFQTTTGKKENTQRKKNIKESFKYYEEFGPKRGKKKWGRPAATIEYEKLMEYADEGLSLNAAIERLNFRIRKMNEDKPEDERIRELKYGTVHGRLKAEGLLREYKDRVESHYRKTSLSKNMDSLNTLDQKTGGKS